MFVNGSWLSGNASPREIQAYMNKVTRGTVRECMRKSGKDFVSYALPFVSVVFIVFMILSGLVPPSHTNVVTFWLGATLILDAKFAHGAFRVVRMYLQARAHQKLIAQGRIHDPKQSMLRYVLQKEGDSLATRRLLEKYPQEVDAFLLDSQLQFIRTTLGSDAEEFLNEQGKLLVERLRGLEAAEVEAPKQVARDMIERRRAGLE